MIEGRWALAGGEQDGQEITESVRQNSRLEIVGNEHTVNLGDDVLRGTHTIDTSQNPHTIDATDAEGPFAGQTLLGIFQVVNGIFTVCFAAPGKPRPTNFTCQDGHASILHSWKRAT